jgi:hypothetical protein
MNIARTSARARASVCCVVVSNLVCYEVLPGIGQDSEHSLADGMRVFLHGLSFGTAVSEASCEFKLWPIAIFPQARERDQGARHADGFLGQLCGRRSFRCPRGLRL